MQRPAVEGNEECTGAVSVEGVEHRKQGKEI